LNGVGFFGKIPFSGDFVGRGLNSQTKQFWDRWLSQHLATPNNRIKLPETGLRLSGPNQLGVILQSQDKIDRKFPLLVMSFKDRANVTVEAADLWINQVLPTAMDATNGALSADQLEAALERMNPPDWNANDAGGLRLWSQKTDPYKVTTTRPDFALKKICS